MAGNKVYVGDLGDNVEEDEIKQAFMTIGEVTEVELKSNFAFVHMADSNDVDEAISKLHKTEIGGKVVRVEKPRPRRPRGRGMGGPGGNFGSRGNDCFNCGMSGHWQRECRKPPGGGNGGGMGGPGGYRAGYGGGGFGGGGYGMGGYGGGRGGPPQGGRGGMMGGGPYNGGGGRGDGGNGGGMGGGGRGRGMGGPPGGRGRGRGNCFRCNSPSHWSRECPQENGQQGEMNRFE